MPILRLVGTPAIGLDPAATQPLERKDAAWLALLALDGPCPRERVAAWLWPQAAAKTAAGSLRQRIFRLRHSLGHALVKAGTRIELLPDVHVDLGADPTDTTEPAGVAAQSLAHLPAPLLAAFHYDDCPEFADWLRQQRARRRLQGLDALAALAARREAGGELAAALEAAQAILVEEPLSEHALRRVMRLHYLRGDRAAAITTFERGEQALKHELGTRPGAETLVLLATIESARPPTAPRPSPVPASLKRPPRLVGRQHELAELAAAWAAERVFVLLGEAGMGKTRLLADFVAMRVEMRSDMPASVPLAAPQIAQKSVQAGEAGPATAGPPPPNPAPAPAPPPSPVTRTLSVAARPGDSGVPFALLARLLRLLHTRLAPPADAATRRELARLLPELAGVDLPVPGDGQRALLQRAVAVWLNAGMQTSAQTGAQTGAQAGAQAGARTGAQTGAQTGVPPATPVGTSAATPMGLQAVLVDDLHFADAASLDLLQALVTTPDLPLRWGLAQRSGEGGDAVQALHTALVEAQLLHPVPLLPLTEAQMAELLASLGLPELEPARLAAPLWRHSGGNPLFALETLKDWVLRRGQVPLADAEALPQPSTVSALIDRRLKALSAPALMLARVAAVAGVDFDIALAEAVLQTPVLALADAWAELEAAQVLAGNAFAHDLVYDAVQRSVPSHIARHVHGAVAGLLQGRGAEPVRTAWHWQAAARWPEAAVAFALAAEAARVTGRQAEGLVLAEHAVQAQRAAGDAPGVWRAELASVELVLAQRGPDAATTLAERLLAEAGSGFDRAAALNRLGLVHLYASRWPQALHASTQALALLPEGADLALRLEAAQVNAQALALLGRYAEAAQRLQALLPTVRQQASAAQRFNHLTAWAYVLNQAGRPSDCAAALREALDAAGRAGDAMELAVNTANLAGVEFDLGRATAALVRGQAAETLYAPLVDSSGPHAASNAFNVGVFAAAVGEYGQALARLEPAPQQLLPLGAVSAGNAACHLATLWLQLGQPHRAEATLAAAPACDEPWVQLRRAVLQVRTQRLRGRQGGPAWAQALAQLDAAEAPAGATAKGRKQQFGARLERSRGCAEDMTRLAEVRAVREAALAAELYGVALHAQMRELDLLLARVPADADAATAAADAEVTAAAADLAAYDSALSPSDGYLPELWLLLARAAARRGEADAARHHLDTAMAWVQAAAASLPVGLRRAFLEHNPVNADITRLLRQPPPTAAGKLS